MCWITGTVLLSGSVIQQFPALQDELNQLKLAKPRELPNFSRDETVLLFFYALYIS
jgi:hypothetical protein